MTWQPQNMQHSGTVAIAGRISCLKPCWGTMVDLIAGVNLQILAVIVIL